MMSRWISLGVASVILSISYSAAAGQGGFTTWQNPAIGCRSVDPYQGQNASFIANYSRLLNVGSGDGTVWCPLPSFSVSGFGVMAPWSISVDVSPGWVNTQSCYFDYWDGPYAGSWWFLTNIGHNADGSDTVSWSDSGFNPGDCADYATCPPSPVTGSEVQCNVPPGQSVFDYNERVYEYFDWTTW